MNEYIPTSVSHPGATISDLLEMRYLLPAELAERLGVDEATVGRLLSGAAPIDASLAERLANHLGGTTEFWLVREKHYRDRRPALIPDRTRPRYRCIHIGDPDEPGVPYHYRFDVAFCRDAMPDVRCFKVEVCSHCALYLRNAIVEKTREVFLPELVERP